MKNLKFSKILALVTIVLICIVTLLTYLYEQATYNQRVPSYEFNATSRQKLLIVKQNSPFKDSVTTLVTNYYKSDSVAIEVKDVTALKNTNASDFDAILIVHRWEAGAPSWTVQSFMDKNSRTITNIVMLTTSWNGLEKMDNVDAVTGASHMANVPIIAKKIVERLDYLLNIKR